MGFNRISFNCVWQSINRNCHSKLIYRLFSHSHEYCCALFTTVSNGKDAPGQPFMPVVLGLISLCPIMLVRSTGMVRPESSHI